MESLEQLVARVNASSFFLSSKEDESAPPRRKPHRLAKLARKLSPAQLELLLELLEGDRALVTVGGLSYAVRRAGDGWSVRGVYEGSVERAVAADLSVCSCEDSKFRERACKHVLALRKLLT